jgi:predicted ArsR family transcriptional regulator
MSHHGDHFRSIARSLGLSIGTTRHHLAVLSKAGLVRGEYIGPRCRYFALTTGSGSGSNEQGRRYWQTHDLRARVWSAVQTLPNPSPSTVASLLGVSRQLAAYHLGHLAELGIVESIDGQYRASVPVGSNPDLYRRTDGGREAATQPLVFASASRVLGSNPPAAIPPAPVPIRPQPKLHVPLAPDLARPVEPFWAPVWESALHR